MRSNRYINRLFNTKGELFPILPFRDVKDEKFLGCGLGPNQGVPMNCELQMIGVEFGCPKTSMRIPSQ